MIAIWTNANVALYNYIGITLKYNHYKKARLKIMLNWGSWFYVFAVKSFLNGCSRFIIYYVAHSVCVNHPPNKDIRKKGIQDDRFGDISLFDCVYCKGSGFVKYVYIFSLSFSRRTVTRFKKLNSIENKHFDKSI